MNKEIDIEKLKEEYYSGKPVMDICNQFGISKQTLYNRLQSVRCELRRQKLYEIDDCPLFGRDYYNIIQCDDVGEWEKLTLSFRDKETKNAYKKKYCKCFKYKQFNYK